MATRASVKTVFTLLVLAAGALGSSELARADQGPSTNPLARADAAPMVKAYGGLARRGFPVYFSFRVQDDGPVTVQATLRLRTRLALSGTIKRDRPIWDTRQLWKPRPIRRIFRAGRYTFCVVATDSAGQHAKSCVPYRVV